ncbi:MAG: M18 family aminopeptidase [Parachlamydiales bacterium]|nr:M18 family aminopeptidase [Parachlamydiales bacterium]
MTTTTSFCEFLNQTPTSWHAISVMKAGLKKAGFKELLENQTWKVQYGGAYFVARGGTLGAFVIPQKKLTRAHLVYSHTDSPSLKLKPHAEYHQSHMTQWGVEVYGEPLLSSWLNRDLSLAGRIHFGNKSIEEKLVRLTTPFTIPQLAVHLDREVNDKGLLLNRQDHLPVLAQMSSNEKKSLLSDLLKPHLKGQKLRSFELFFYPLEEARMLGQDEDLVASYRLDNLSSAFPCYSAIKTIGKTSNDTLALALFWDHEEIGSTTHEGASSPFLTTVLERICLGLNLDRQDYLKLLSQSKALSLDAAHALHPNYLDRSEPRHEVLLGKGVALKVNAKQRYAYDGKLAAEIQLLAQHHRIPLQTYVNRTNLPCGSTVGPLSSAQSGIMTLDLGCPLLSMHSIREIVSFKDVLTMEKLVKAFLKNNESFGPL